MHGNAKRQASEGLEGFNDTVPAAGTEYSGNVGREKGLASVTRLLAIIEARACHTTVVYDLVCDDKGIARSRLAQSGYWASRLFPVAAIVLYVCLYSLYYCATNHISLGGPQPHVC